MTEVLRSHEDARLRDGFRAELNVPMEGGGGGGFSRAGSFKTAA